MFEFRSRADLERAISAQIAARNLAAVIVQLNDTYLIDERPGIPGLARVAALIGDTRRLVEDGLGADRTLVLHAGDYLSPSLMSKARHGKQMLDLLGHCRVDFATIGNHEFDLKEPVLRRRLESAPFRTVAANLAPGAGGAPCRIEPLVLWPPRHPFLAITGIAGEQTRGKAIDSGWNTTGAEAAIESIIARVVPDPRLRALVVLTHMDRAEDLAFRGFVQNRWPTHAPAYIIAGHDHDIYWAEPQEGRVFLSKALSNAKTVTAILIPRDFLATLGWPPALAEGASDCRSAADVVRAYRAAVPQGVRREFRASFERRLRTVHRRYFAGYSEDLIADDTLAHHVAEQAYAESRAEAAAAFHAVAAGELIAKVPPDPAALDRIAHWQRDVADRLALPPDEVVVALDDPRGDGPPLLDISDNSMRMQSTVFGNFVADAVRQAMAADIALINAGCFRFDGEISRRVTLHQLYEIFLYDGTEALVVLPMTAAEVVAFYDHAIARGGHGAFMQVSEAEDAVRRRPAGTLEVALVAHMLVNVEDGYLPILARLRGIAESELRASVKDEQRPRDSLIAAIRRGVASAAVAYCDAPRLAARRGVDRDDALLASWKALVNDYDARCDAAGIDRLSRLIRLEDPPAVTLAANRAIDPARKLAVAWSHQAMLDLVRSLDGEALDALRRRLEAERQAPEDRDVFIRYLDALTGRLFPPDRGIVI